MRKAFALLIFCLLFQLSTGAHVAVTVQPDRVLIGAANEFIPRRLDLTNKLVVLAGQAVELAPVSSYDYVEVQPGGTLSASRTHSTLLRVTTLVILPGGTLDIGTVADPIPCNLTVEIVIRDVPIDLTRDPVQWGNGLVNFGTQTRVGCEKTPWIETTGSLLAGATSALLASIPSGWQVGDELLIPDTRTPVGFTAVDGYTNPRRETRVTLAAINATTITFSKPLDFEHLNILDPQGVLVLRPRIANLTRNITLRSENPNGSRGHTVDLGDTARWDIRANQLIGLGRTQNIPLDDTTLDASFAVLHQGGNQRGKYAEHHHHNGSAVGGVGGVDEDNVYVGLGLPSSKWGLALHQTSDVRVERNIVVDFPGAGIATEDGPEVRNIISHNFLAYNLGHERDAQGNVFDAPGNLARNCPGCEGTGIWAHGVMNAFDGNETWNNFTSGINLFNQSQPVGSLYPSAPGAMADTVLDHFKLLPLSFDANIAAANVANGFEFWAVHRTPYTNLIAAHNEFRNVAGFNSDGIDLYFVNATVIGESGTGCDGIDSSMGYVGNFEMVGGQVAGCAIGIHGGGGSSSLYLTNTILQNEVNLDMVAQNSRFTNVQHVPLGSFPHQYILMGDGAIWHPPDPLPKVGVSTWVPAQGSTLIVNNWQGTGQDYRLFYPQSLGNNPAWYSSLAEGVHVWNCPVVGLTMRQCWQTYGLSYGHEMLEEADALPLDGVINGLAKAGLTIALGPPRAIVTFPTMRAPVVLEGGTTLHVYVVLTGNRALASNQVWVQVDQEAPAIFARDNPDLPDFTGDGARITPGVHTVTVARTSVADPLAVLPETQYTSCYYIGPTPTTVPAICGTAPPPATTCQDPPATNVGGPLPCVFPPPPPLTCQDPKATNRGGPLPCVFPPPPVDVCPNIPGVQTTVPAGLVLLDGICVTPPPVGLLPPGTYTFTVCNAAQVCATVTWVVK